MDSRSQGNQGDPQDLVVYADLVRGRLLKTVDTLDHRWRDALNLELQARRHAVALVVVGSVVAVALAGFIALVVQGWRGRGRRVLVLKLR